MKREEEEESRRGEEERAKDRDKLPASSLAAATGHRTLVDQHRPEDPDFLADGPAGHGAKHWAPREVRKYSAPCVDELLRRTLSLCGIAGR